MIKITNGSETYTVTQGAYKDIFKPQGFYEVSDNRTEMREETSFINEGSLTPTGGEPTSEAISVQETEDSEPDIASGSEEAPSDLSEVPLSEMTDKQLREYAKQLGVNLKGITSRKAVRDKIRSVL